MIAHDPFGANSVCQGYGYKRPEWTLHNPLSRAGFACDTGTSTARHLESTRDVQVYLPATFRDNRRYPLLVVHDGDDYLRFADLKTVLDNLIHRLEIPPLIAAMMQSPDRLTRVRGQRPARDVYRRGTAAVYGCRVSAA